MKLRCGIVARDNLLAGPGYQHGVPRLSRRRVNKFPALNMPCQRSVQECQNASAEIFKGDGAYALLERELGCFHGIQLVSQENDLPHW